MRTHQFLSQGNKLYAFMYVCACIYVFQKKESRILKLSSSNMTLVREKRTCVLREPISQPTDGANRAICDAHGEARTFRH